MAAVLAGGPGAALSHQSAAALHGVRAASSGSIHVTAPRRLQPRRDLIFHHSSLPTDEVTVIDGIPVTGVCRTIFDIAANGTQTEIERVLHEAEVDRLTDRVSLGALIERYPRHRGTGKLKAAFADRRLGAGATKSELEELFLSFIARHHLPRPEINNHVRVADGLFEVDAVWRDARVTVELDGRAAHLTTKAFERDRVRDRTLQAAGWKVIRITWRQLHQEPHALAADLRLLLPSRDGEATGPLTSEW